MTVFKNRAHEMAYKELVEEMYLSEEEQSNMSTLLKRQLAFVYLIALYQEEYEAYEGERFYIEYGEELSVGGPTYLMEEAIGERKYAHEKMIYMACQILRGERPEKVNEIEEDQIFLEQAIKLSH